MPACFPGPRMRLHPTMQHQASSAGTVVTRIVPYTDLQAADLIVDAIYKGHRTSSISNEPIFRLLGCGYHGEP